MVIAFIGSVFSPYYAWAHRRAAGRGGAAALDHCAVNIALYSPGRAAWAMTERGRQRVQRSASHLQIGASSLRWAGDALELQLDETSVPWMRRLRGTVRLHPAGPPGPAWGLSACGRHTWQPLAPGARVEVALDEPGPRWSGSGYFDTNQGPEPLANAFREWHWSRAALPGGRSVVLYDTVHAGPRGSPPTGQSLALHFDARGGAQAFEPPPVARLSASRWGVGRATRSEAGATLQKTLEDTPFYARSLVQSRLFGQPAMAVHESLDLRRFSSPVVQAMLPFRMPRRA